MPLLRHAIFAIRCPDPAAAASSTSGSKNHRTTLYCLQADSAAAAFCVSAWLTFVFQRGYLLCSSVICNSPEHGSVIALDCKSSATCDSRVDWICKLFITSHLRKDLSHGLLSFLGMVTQLGRAGARRALGDAPRSACPAHGSRLLISVNLLWIANQRQRANQPVCPSIAFSYVRLIRERVGILAQ